MKHILLLLEIVLGQRNKNLNQEKECYKAFRGYACL